MGTGRIPRGRLEAMLQLTNVPRESAVDSGIQFIRRTHSQGYHYFFVNSSEKPVSQWISLGRPAESPFLMDSQVSDLIGEASPRREKDSTQFFLQLLPGKSVILRTFTTKKVDGPKWQYTPSKGPGLLIEDKWDVTFIDGGPNLPGDCQMKQLASWTNLDDSRAKSFAGTARYKFEFDKPVQEADSWILELGQLCESARVSLNGRMVGMVWCEPFQCRIGKYIHSGKNVLEIEVTNLAAGCIRDMDQRRVNWKYFYDINVVDKNYKTFDASAWPLRNSGLLGPVKVIPQLRINPEEKTAFK